MNPKFLLMKEKAASALILFMTFASIHCQNSDAYQVYAIKFENSFLAPASDIAVGASTGDSVRMCFMFWLLKGDNGRNILVDAGFIDSAAAADRNYVRPDRMLQRINIFPEDITDIIVTHPHFDHIGGVNLFPKATVWMQKKDYYYFVGDAWQEDGFSEGFEKEDVRTILEINLQGRLTFVDGDNIEIMPGIKVYTGSKHTYENQYLLVNSNSESNKILIASDAIWLYYNLDNLLTIPTYVFDPIAYVEAMKRMKTLVTNPDFIIPGQDDRVFSKFPEVYEGIVKIGN